MRFSGSLERGDLVCQGQAVLRATVEYRLVTAGSAEAVAELIGTAIKSALEGALQTSIATTTTAGSSPASTCTTGSGSTRSA